MQKIIDLQRYPIDKPDSTKYKDLVKRCQNDLRENGMFSLDGFMFSDVAEKAASSLEQKFISESFKHEREHNIYFKKEIPDIKADHDVQTRFSTSNYTLCGDQVTDTPMDQLYRSSAFAQFLGASLNKSVLYPMDDALAGLNVMSYAENQQLNWHFDRSEFTTTLLLQAPESGGEFIYRKNLRSDNDPNYEGVAKLIRGEDEQVTQLQLHPGTLNVFKGKNTAHRVNATRGKRTRVITVFCYYETPGAKFTDEENIGFYGRAG